MNNCENCDSLGDRIETWLENDMVCSIAAGASIALSIILAILAIVICIAAIGWSAWWWLALIPDGLLCGTSFGFAGYLFDKYC